MSSQALLYTKQEKIYPRETSGRFQRLRSYAVWCLLGIYYAAPHLAWDGRQAILFDLPARKFYIFGAVFLPHDFFFLAVLLMIAAVLLFFVTAVAGRVWCGYACPQTVWTEAFVWMERLTEGSRSQQIRLANQPWDSNKIRKVVLKQTLWISFSLFTGLTFVGYFNPINELIPNFFTLEASGWATFWVLFYSMATYGNAGFLREQVCKYMCPYARFQSAMFDKDTLIVTYDYRRGEPRKKGRRSASDSSNQIGDCIDCRLCVQVCPTGIDIRDGLQYECIGCAACIDVCNKVMAQTGMPPNLVRYSTESLDQGNNKSLREILMRTRTLAYLCLLALIFLAWVFAMSQRPLFHIDVAHDRNPLFRLTQNDRIENTYQIKLINKTNRAQ
ncbi:MAG: cytochrome c oxidase accessory protein CcoG, partial [Pseudomonadota bacterium]